MFAREGTVGKGSRCAMLCFLVNVRPPEPDEVDLWVFDLGPAAAGSDRRARTLLSDEERERMDRVTAPLARERRTRARAATRSILAGYLGESPERVTLTHDKHGKPTLIGGAQPAFNLSHSGSLGVLAVTGRVAVGVDVELLGRHISPALCERAFSESERRLLSSEPDSRRPESLLRLWTAKEACAKALGVGLGIDMADVVIGGTPQTPKLVGALARSWTLASFSPLPGAVGAVVAAGGPWRARRRAWAERL